MLIEYLNLKSLKLNIFILDRFLRRINLVLNFSSIKNSVTIFVK